MKGGESICGEGGEKTLARALTFFLGVVKQVAKMTFFSWTNEACASARARVRDFCKTVGKVEKLP